MQYIFERDNPSHRNGAEFHAMQQKFIVTESHKIVELAAPPNASGFGDHNGSTIQPYAASRHVYLPCQTS